MYIRQLSIQLELSKRINGGNCPCLIGEFGCHMDLQKGKSYKQWQKGKRIEKAFKWQIIALDLMYNALDRLFLNSTLWNYTADNDNTWGDRWNQEDLSIFSRDQQTVDWHQDLNSGGRAIPGFCRPYARRTAGTPLRVEFTRKKGIFHFEFETDASISAPTEIYVPNIQFPQGCDVECTGAEWHFLSDQQLLLIENPVEKHVSVTLKRRK